jgi:hypothetical protein
MAARRENRSSDAGDSAPCVDKDSNSPCACRSAVTRTYFEMIINAAAPTEAMEAAVRVYSYHHPGYGPANTVRLIEQWLAPSALH